MIKIKQGMRYIIKLLLVVIAAMAICGPLSAQNDRHRISREQLAEIQAKHIAEEAGMDEATTKRFVETYCQYQQEIWAIGPRNKRQGRSLSDEESEEILKERFAHRQKVLDIQQKYYALYSQFLTQKQILQVNESEKQMMRRLAGQKGQQRRRGR